MQKYLKNKDVVLEEYERAKNRNYKRVERFENKLSNKPIGKDLTFSQYDSWMHRMSSAKTMYLQGELNADEFLLLIHELDEIKQWLCKIRIIVLQIAFFQCYREL